MNTRFFSLLYFFEAVVISAIVRVVLRFFSASVRLRWMGQSVEEHYQLGEPAPAQLDKLRAVKRSIDRCHRYVPWNTECYTQALTARLMLRRRKIPLLLYIGFKKEESQSLQGHAWTACGPYIVTGYRNDLSRYTLNGCFL